MANGTHKKDNIVVSLEGLETLQGRVDALAYYRHINRLIEVFGALERVFLGAPKRKTRYLIADQKRVNPYVAELAPNAMEQGYAPSPAQHWAAEQFHIIRAGGTPDSRVTATVLDDIAKLPPGKNELVRNFKMNGFSEEVKFDQQFRDNALMRAAERRSFESEHYFSGEVLGEVRGILLKLDALEGDIAVIVPDIGASQIRCEYPETMRHVIGRYYDRRIIARGVLRYSEHSPFPEVIVIQDGDIEEIPETEGDSLLELEGIFEGCYEDGEDRSYFA